MTLADVYLAVMAGQALFAPQSVMDKKTRDKELPNFTRFATLVLEMIGQDPSSMFLLSEEQAQVMAALPPVVVE